MHNAFLTASRMYRVSESEAVYNLQPLLSRQQTIIQTHLWSYVIIWRLTHPTILKGKKSEPFIE